MIVWKRRGLKNQENTWHCCLQEEMQTIFNRKDVLTTEIWWWNRSAYQETELIKGHSVLAFRVETQSSSSSSWRRRRRRRGRGKHSCEDGEWYFNRPGSKVSGSPAPIAAVIPLPSLFLHTGAKSLAAGLVATRSKWTGSTCVWRTQCAAGLRTTTSSGRPRATVTWSGRQPDEAAQHMATLSWGHYASSGPLQFIFGPFIFHRPGERGAL